MLILLMIALLLMLMMAGEVINVSEKNQRLKGRLRQQMLMNTQLRAEVNRLTEKVKLLKEENGLNYFGDLLPADVVREVSEEAK